MANTSQPGKSILALTKKIKALDPLNGPTIIENVVKPLLNQQPGTINFTPIAPATSSTNLTFQTPRTSPTTTTTTTTTGTGFGKKRGPYKKAQKLKNVKIIRGGGCSEILNESKTISTKKSANRLTKNKQFYHLNKYIFDVDLFNNENVIELRYSLNGGKVRDLIVPNDDIKSIIADICVDEFTIEKFNKLKKDEQSFIRKFAEKCHMDLGNDISSIEDDVLNYEIYYGELEAGNSQPIIIFLFKSFCSGKLDKNEYLEAMENIINNKINS